MMSEQTGAHTTDIQTAPPTEPTMQVQTSRFGELEIPESSQFAFRRGLPGFSETLTLYLFPNPGGGSFEWLHAGDESDVGFVVLAPIEPIADLLADGLEGVRRQLGWAEDDVLETRLIISIPSGAPDQATANLRAPILLNRTRGEGVQAVLEDAQLPLRLPLFSETPVKS